MGLIVELGAPFEAIMNKIIDRGYATNKSELIRHALILYEHVVDEEETSLVHTAMDSIVIEEKAGKRKTISLEEIKEELNL